MRVFRSSLTLRSTIFSLFWMHSRKHYPFVLGLPPFLFFYCCRTNGGGVGNTLVRAMSPRRVTILTPCPLFIVTIIVYGKIMLVLQAPMLRLYLLFTSTIY